MPLSFWLLTVFLGLPLLALEAADGSYERVSLTVNGLKRSYLIHVPNGIGSTPAPLVLMLHGAGGSAEGAAKNYGWLSKADQEGFIVVFPEALPLDPSQPAQFKTNPTLWNDGSKRGRIDPHDDIAYLREVVQDVARHHAIDRQRIFCTGHSNGASMCFLAGIEMSDVFAAIAPVAGHLWNQDPHPKKTLSLLFIVGGADPLNPIDGGLGRSLWSHKANNPKPPMIDSVNPWLKLIGVNESQKRVEKKDDLLITRYGPNPVGQEVVYIIVEGQGHEWPGGQSGLPEAIMGKNKTSFSATNAIWDFFKQNKL